MQARLVFNRDESDPCSPVATPPWQALMNWKALHFFSNFESANLRRAVQIDEFEYDLLLATDTNTRRHVQWFYFRVGGTLRGAKYKFNVVNMRKRDSLFNYGLRPLMLSTKLQQQSNIGWQRVGSDIAYFRSSIHRNNGRGLYTLSFTIEMPCLDDDVYIAHSYPYTTADLTSFLSSLQADPHRSRFVKQSSLCTTIGGREVPLLTITAPPCRADEQLADSAEPGKTKDAGEGAECVRVKESAELLDCKEKPLEERRVVFISSRVHPGETPASWIMHGLLDFLTSPEEEVARQLRQQIVFNVVPMLNPDGVAAGNYRTSLSGHDLNRVWAAPDRHRHPGVCFYVVYCAVLGQHKPADTLTQTTTCQRFFMPRNCLGICQRRLRCLSTCMRTPGCQTASFTAAVLSKLRRFLRAEPQRQVKLPALLQQQMARHVTRQEVTKAAEIGCLWWTRQEGGGRIPGCGEESRSERTPRWRHSSRHPPWQKQEAAVRLRSPWSLGPKMRRPFQICSRGYSQSSFRTTARPSTTRHAVSTSARAKKGALASLRTRSLRSKPLTRWRRHSWAELVGNSEGATSPSMTCSQSVVNLGSLWRHFLTMRASGGPCKPSITRNAESVLLLISPGS